MTICSLWAGVGQCSGTSRTVCHDQWLQFNGRTASCLCIVRTTPTCFSTCVALSAASCLNAAPAMRNSPTRMGSGTCRMRYSLGRGLEVALYLWGKWGWRSLAQLFIISQLSLVGWTVVVRVGLCSCGNARDKLTLTLWFRLLRSGQPSVSCVWMMSQCSASTTVCVRFWWPLAPLPLPRYVRQLAHHPYVLGPSHIFFSCSPGLLSFLPSVFCCTQSPCFLCQIRYFLRIFCRNSAAYVCSCDDSKLRQE